MGGVAIFELSAVIEIQTPRHSIKDAVSLSDESRAKSVRLVVWHAGASDEARRISRLKAHAAHPGILS